MDYTIIKLHRNPEERRSIETEITCNILRNAHTLSDYDAQALICAQPEKLPQDILSWSYDDELETVVETARQILKDVTDYNTVTLSVNDDMFLVAVGNDPFGYSLPAWMGFGEKEFSQKIDEIYNQPDMKEKMQGPSVGDLRDEIAILNQRIKKNKYAYGNFGIGAIDFLSENKYCLNQIEIRKNKIDAIERAFDQK